MSAFWPVLVCSCAGVTRVAISGPPDAPHAPQRGRVAQWIAVDQEEVRRSSLADRSGGRLIQQLAAAPRRGRKRLPWLEAGTNQRLDFPGELVGAQRATTEIGAGRDRDTRGAREPNALL